MAEILAEVPGVNLAAAGAAAAAAAGGNIMSMMFTTQCFTL